MQSAKDAVFYLVAIGSIVMVILLPSFSSASAAEMPSELVQQTD